MTENRESRFDRLSEEFDRIADLDGDARAIALADLDTETRNEVEELLSALERKGDRLEAQRVKSADGIGGSDIRVGAYRLLRIVGRGGMGAVYEAERADAAFVKRVAVKLIRDDIGGESMSRRFERERAILAGLEHPNIARMLDGGTLSDGREYLVMEFVDGVSLTSYCKKNRATLRERLGLFLQVCDAVQYAHQHLVVHGDIKPGNILVTPAGVVKLVDFGVAKLIDEAEAGSPNDSAADAARDPLTVAGMPLTPAYASPQRLRGESISLLEDVYALGVVLYELICGKRPFSNEPRDDAATLIADIERGPRKPSESVSEESAHAMREQNMRHARKTLRGELDTIVSAALDASEKRRYSSVERLAEDVRRHIDGRLVLAQPPTRAYRASKFVRRNAWSVAAGTAIALAVVAGGIAATVQARRADRERAEAVREKAVAERISKFLESMLSAPDPSWVHAGKTDARVADILDGAAARVDTGLAGYPAATAMVRRTIGIGYAALGRFTDGETQLTLALDLDRRRSAPSVPDLADDLHELGSIRYRQGDWSHANQYFAEAARRCHGAVADTALVCMKVSADYASTLVYRSEFAQADAYMQDAVHRARARFGPRHGAVAVLNNNVAALHALLGDPRGAESFARSAVGAWDGKGREPSERPSFFHTLGAVALSLGDLPLADSASSSGLASSLRTHQTVGIVQAVLFAEGAAVARRRANLARADSLLQNADASLVGPAAKHPLASGIMLEHGMLDVARRNAGSGEVRIRAAIAMLGASIRPDDVRLAHMDAMLGISIAAQARFAEADSILRAASAIYAARGYPSSHPLAAEIHAALSELASSRAAGENAAAAASRFAAFVTREP